MPLNSKDSKKGGPLQEFYGPRKAEYSYDFYREGISEQPRGNWACAERFANAMSTWASQKVVVVSAIVALCWIACEFIPDETSELNAVALIGALALAAMILGFGILALYWSREETYGQQGKQHENKEIPPESLLGSEGPGSNGASPG